jgi:P27 family predicted phage terminase small subunit
MAQPGPKPKPTELKKLAGNPGKRPLNSQEPQPEPASTRCPHGLSDGAKKFWRKQAKQMIELGVLTSADVPAFILMAEHLAIAREAREIIADSGLMDKDVNGVDRKHPLLQVWRDNSTAYRMYASEFGLTPSSRSRLKVTAPEEEPSLAELLFNAQVSDE